MEPSSSSPSIDTIRCPNSSLPSDVLRFMKKNASPQQALQLMQIHKFFQFSKKFPYFVVKKLEFESDYIWKYQTLDNRWHLSTGKPSFNNFNEKLWITEKLHLSWHSINISTIFSKIGVCDVDELVIHSQTLTYNNLKFLIPTRNKIKKLDIKSSKFMYIDKERMFKFIPVEEIVKLVPNIESFSYNK